MPQAEETKIKPAFTLEQRCRIVELGSDRNGKLVALHNEMLERIADLERTASYYASMGGTVRKAVDSNDPLNER